MMLASLTVFVFMVASVTLTQAGNGPYVDPYECSFGQDYAKHQDCDKYIRCTRDDNGGIVRVERQCAFGTFWNHDVFTCSVVDLVDCPKDKCKRMPSPRNGRYKGNGNCRGYYECENMKSKTGCCAVGQEYDEVNGCIFDINESCNDSCFGTPEPKPPVCDKRPISGQESEFEQYSNGVWVPMKCGPGSVYEHNKCMCFGFGNAPPQSPFCTREIYLPFTSNLMDQSGKNHAVLAHDVELNPTEGKAIFNGNSRLEIPRFNNLDHVKSLYIKIKYVAYSGSERRVIVSNKCQNTDYSVMLTHKGTNKRFSVKTDAKTFALNIRQNQYAGTQDVEYKIDDGVFTGESGGVVQVADIDPIYIKQISCPINIGWGAGRNGFKGEIDEVEIYLCDPRPR